MVRFLIIGVISLNIFFLLNGCSANNNEEQYLVVVVEGQENMIKRFEEYTSFEKPLIEIEYYKKVKDAQEQFPNYKIEEIPVTFIFSRNEDKTKKLILKTNDINESLRVLKKLKKEMHAN
jgi:hypothetical protein